MSACDPQPTCLGIAANSCACMHFASRICNLSMPRAPSHALVYRSHCSWLREIKMKIDGRCHCGYITFEAEIEPEKTLLCNCTDCQTFSGSAFRVHAFTREDAFRLLSGEPKIYVKTAESGNKRPQAFCPECGTHIYAVAIGAGPKIYAIRAGSIRQRDQIVPRTQWWSRSALPWLAQAGLMQTFEKQP